MSDATHIADLDPSTVTVGDLIDQAGIIYRVTAIHPSPVFNGFGAIDFEWTGAKRSDVFRTTINAGGYTGQIRWHSPYWAPEVMA